MKRKASTVVQQRMVKAIKVGDLCEVKEVIREGVDLNREMAGHVPLVFAIVMERPAIVRELLSSAADPNLRSNDMTPLMWACEYGTVKIAEELMAHGADPNLKVLKRFDWLEPGITALMFAAKRGHKELIEILLKSGADITAVTSGGWSALNWACESGQSEIAKMLIKRGCPVLGDVLREPVVRNDAEMVRMLIKFGASIESLARDYPRSSMVKSLLGKSMLGIAASKGSAEAARELIRTGADINRVVNQSSPLGWAVCNNRVEVVRILLKNGADVKIGAVGRTALDLALANEFSEIIALLSSGKRKEKTTTKRGSKQGSRI